MGTLLNGCGFHPRGSMSLPSAYQRIVLVESRQSGDQQSAVAKTLTKILQQNGVQVIDTPSLNTNDPQMLEHKPQAVIRLISQDYHRRTIASGARGQVREYELTLRVKFEIIGADEQVLVPPSLTEARQDLQYDEARVLGRAQGEEIVESQMRNDVAYAIVRRLTASQSHAD